MDWNCDGNHDWKDDAFYNNIVSEKCEINGGSNGSYSSGESASSNSSITWFVV